MHVHDSITFTRTLEARHEAIYFLARLIHEHCARLGTRRGTRVLGPFRQAVLAVRWFLDGTLIHTDRIAARGPNGADLWWSGKHKDHGGNVHVLSHPGGFPCWISEVRPGRERDTTCAKNADGLLPALEEIESEDRIPTLTDLGYLGLSR